MTIGVSKETTIIGIMPEVTEGTYVVPAANTDYVQPTEDFSIEPAKELVERTILTSGFGKATPRTGTKSVTASLALEQRGSGTEGAQSDAHTLLKATLGGNREVTAVDLIEAASTTTVLNLTGHAYTAGDIVCVKESGAHDVRPVLSVTTDTVTLAFALSGTPSVSTEVSKCQTYFPSDALSDYETLSMSVYHGNEIREAATGLRPASMALEGFSTGGLATWSWGLDGLAFSEVDGAAPHTPSYDSQTPPLILSACVYVDGVSKDLNDFSFNVENSLGFLTSTCSSDGRISSRFNGKRTITATINPYKDDASVDFFTKFDNDTAFSLFAYSANPSGTTGELEMGSIVGYYMPNCVITSKVVSDLDGVLIEDLQISVDGGSAGTSTEIYIGLI